MPYHFYILYSGKLDNYYVGHTADLAERVRKHNTHHKGFTGKSDDWELVYTESFPEKQAVYAHEQCVGQYPQGTPF